MSENIPQGWIEHGGDAPLDTILPPALLRDSTTTGLILSGLEASGVAFALFSPDDELSYGSTAFKLLFDVQPDDNNVTLTSIAITPLTLALSLAGANIKKITVNATYSDASVVDVSAACTYTVDVISRATVDKGYVKGLTVGVANVGATFKGKVAPAPCVVTVSA